MMEMFVLNILRYRAPDNSNSKQFLDKPKRIKYTSATNKNAMNVACNSVLLALIIIRVNKAIYSTVVDETTDITGI